MHSWTLAAWEQGLELGSEELLDPDGLCDCDRFCCTINSPPNPLLSPMSPKEEEGRGGGGGGLPLKTEQLYCSSLAESFVLMSLFERLESCHVM